MTVALRCSRVTTRAGAFVIGVCTLSIVTALAAVAGGQDPQFAVASVKRSTSALPYSQSTEAADGVAMVNERLRDVILFAFNLYEFQLTGDPPWVSRDRFDIMGRANGPLSFDEKRARLRRLLADRFGLRLRSETREQPVYMLTRASAEPGAGLKRRDCAVSGIGGLACGRGIAAADAGVVRLGGIPIARLAGFLGGVLGRAVLDETKLSGQFDVDLRYRPDIGVSPDLSETAKQEIEARPALPVALREQLGLELVSRRAPVALLVVESIAPPTPD